MTWTTVSSNIDWTTSSWSIQPGATPVSDLSSTDQANVLTALHSLYSASTSIAAMLEAATSSGNKLRIGDSGSSEPGFYQPGVGPYDDYLGFNTNAISTTHFINDHGLLVQDELILTIAHELSHQFYRPSPDPAPSYTGVVGTLDFDFVEKALRSQNSAAASLGLTDKIQLSYRAATSTGSSEYSILSTGQSHTLGAKVDVGVLGASTADAIDLSGRSDNSSDLVFGFDGGDTITSGSGADFLYGGDGDDSLDGGDDNDHIQGGDGDDTIVGAIGIDSLAGNDGNDQIDGGEGADTLLGGDGNDSLTGGQGNDSIDGGSGNDDIAKFSGDCREYDIVKNNDGTWTIEHARGAATDGIDTLSNVEKVQFGDRTEDLNIGICGIDIVLVIDTTESMESYIETVKYEAISMVNSIFYETQHARIAILGYKDPGQYSTILSFTDHNTASARHDAAVTALEGISVSGGGDTPEGTYSALQAALSGSVGSWNESAHVHRIVVVGDAPAKDGYLADTVASLAGNLQGPGDDFKTPYAEISTVLAYDDSNSLEEFNELALNSNGAAYTSLADITAASTSHLSPLTFGSSSGDVMVASAATTRLRGGDGDDTLTGDVSDDCLYGEQGDDLIAGGAGNDTLDGGAGNDTFAWSTGNDLIDGGKGDDTVTLPGNYSAYSVALTLDGAAITHIASSALITVKGAEHLVFADQNLPLNPNASITGTAANETLEGGSGDDTIIDVAGNDIVMGRLGDDYISVSDGAFGNINGGMGIDTLTYEDVASPMLINLKWQFSQSEDWNTGNWIVAIENVIGTDFNDTIAGDSSENFLDGGLGLDTLSYIDADEGISVSLSAGTAQGATLFERSDMLANFENVIGSSYSDTLIGNNGDNYLAGDDYFDDLGYGDSIAGMDGNDSIGASDGQDFYDGGSGHDLLSYEGWYSDFSVDLSTGEATLGGNTQTLSGIEDIVAGGGNDLINGDVSDNYIRADSGDDTVSSGGGNDTLEGGYGADCLTGGSGNDIFVYSSIYESNTLGSADTIADFVIGDDIIDLSRIDVDPSTFSDDAFTFVGASAFSSTAGELRYFTSGGNTHVVADLDGDGSADFEIELTGVFSLTSADFAL